MRSKLAGALALAGLVALCIWIAIAPDAGTAVGSEVAPAPSASDESAPSASRGLVARESPIVFQRAFDDEQASVMLGLRNAGSRTVRIRRVSGGCGCVRVGPVPETLAPGEETEIRFTLRLAGLSGRVSKVVRVSSDDPVTPELRVRIEGDVGPRLVIQPGRAIVKRYAPGDPATADLEIRSGADEPLEGLTAVASIPDVAVTTTVEGTCARVHVVVPPEVAHPRGTITIRLKKYERVLRLTDGSTAAAVAAPSPAGGASAKRRAEADGGGASTGGATLAVAFSGQDLGEMEPCGCSGGMFGGLARRPARLQAFVEPGVPFVAVSGGALVAGRDDYDRLRFEAIARALASMGFAAVAPTRQEIGLGAPESAPPMVAVDVDEDSGFERDLHRMLRLEPGGTVVYVTGVTAPPGGGDVPGVVFTDARQALRDLRGELPVFAPLVILGNVGEEAARDLASHAGRPTLVLYAGGWTDPGPEDVEEGSMAFAPFPAEGKYVGLARLHGRGGTAAWSVEYRPVEAELPEDENIVLLRKEHLDKLRAADLVRSSAGDARFTPHALSGEAPPAFGPDRFVGSAACAECHEEESRSWKASKHAGAMEALRSTGDDADPKCVACHVVGYGTGRGFAGEATTSDLADVGCEACHGPRSTHVERWSKKEGKESASPKGRAACAACHDGKHDPNFDFDAYWPRIAHGTRPGK